MAGNTPLLSAPRPAGKLKIDAVELVALEGRRESVPGINRQYQVNPLHVYEEFRPKPYKDPAEAKPTVSTVRATYLKLRTDGGLDGLYGPVDREAAIVVREQMAGFLKRALE